MLKIKIGLSWDDPYPLIMWVTPFQLYEFLKIPYDIPVKVFGWRTFQTSCYITVLEYDNRQF